MVTVFQISTCRGKPRLPYLILSQSTTNKIQLLTIYFCKTLYMFQMLSASSPARLPTVSSNGLTLYIQFWAPNDGRKTRLKHVERLTEIKKLWNVASCWLYSAYILAMHGSMNVKFRIWIGIETKREREGDWEKWVATKFQKETP